MEDSMRWTRLRWRLRGAWMWPTYVLVTLGEAVLLRLLPFTGDGADLVPALLVAGFFNLLLVAVAAPLAGFALRRRRPDLPRMVAGDYAGTVLLLGVACLVIGGGLLHRPVVAEQDDKLAQQAAAARRFVLSQAPGEFHAGVVGMTSLKLEPDVYRSCVPGPDPKRHFCVFVNTDQSPPGIRKDISREPNASFQGRFGAFRAD